MHKKGEYMRASIEIENSHTKKVEVLSLNVLEFIDNKIIKIDISNLSKEELKLLEDAISSDKKLSYTDIEMFYIDDDTIPYFGPDFDFYIEDNNLVGYYNREIYLSKKGGLK